MFLNDIAETWQISFQDPATKIMYHIISLHDKVMFYLILIVIGTTWMLFVIINKFKYSRKLISHKYMIHGSTIEIIWTILPAIVLLAIAFPSFRLLYLMDEILDPGITIKAIGRQWYWAYEYSDYVDKYDNSLSFDSYMIPISDLNIGDIRLLEVDNQVLLPINTQVRVIITATDVLHSWAIPSLGIKLDAVPGRLNQTGFLLERKGLYYGACSEICGTGHFAMPIVIKGVELTEYMSWIIGLIKEQEEV